MFGFIWDLQQDGRIAKAESDATNAKYEVASSKHRIDELEFALNRMSLASQAMWELLRDRLGITEEELSAKVKEIDLRDGVQDQKITTTLMKCTRCGHTLNTKSRRCIYCGETVPKPNAFQ